jgi:hypothetical protein
MHQLRLAITPLLLASALSAQAPSIPPALPRAVPSTAMPATTRIVPVPAGANLQAALDAAKPGDALELARGATYTGSFILPAKGACGKWIVLRPAGAALPAPGTRMTPALARSLRLPRILGSGNGYAIATALGACGYRLVGLDIGVAPQIAQSYGIVGLGADRSQGQRTVAQTARDLVLDRVYVHGTPTLPLRRCIALNSASTAIVDSWVDECHDVGTDAQAIAGWNGPGPYLIENNELQASTEVVMFGGVDAASAELSPADITIRRNHLSKPIAWKGGRWLIKTILELKNARRVLIEANVLEGNWPQAWDGTAVTLKSVNQDGSAPWSGTADVTMRRNVIRHVGSGMNLHSDPERSKPSVPMARVAIVDNLILGLNSPDYPGGNRAFFFGGHIADLRVEHNTATWVGAGGRSIEYEGDPVEPFPRHRVANNLFATVNGLGVMGQKLGYPGPVWAAWAPDGVMEGNVFGVGPDFASGHWATYPRRNQIVLNTDAAFSGLHLTTENRLSPLSALRGTATDGRDPGADVAAVLAATAGVVDGVPPTTP